MSSLFDVPQQLVVLLSLAASGAGDGRTSALQSVPLPADVAITRAEALDFSEQSWLEALDSGSGGAALAEEQRRVFRTTSGRYYVPVASERQKIMALRRDGETATRVAFDFAMSNAAMLEKHLGRRPSPGELYLAHTLGPETAVKIIASAKTRPQAPLDGRWTARLLAVDRLSGARAAELTAGAVLEGADRALNRRPTGHDVARWFEGGGTLLADAAVSEEPILKASLAGDTGRDESADPTKLASAAGPDRSGADNGWVARVDEAMPQ